MRRSIVSFVLLLLVLISVSQFALAAPARLGGAYRGPGEPAEHEPGIWRTPTPRVLPYPGPRIVYPDVRAYWMYWFEHNKEAMLAERIRERRRIARRSTASSAHWFSRLEARAPVTEETKRRILRPLFAAALKDVHPWVRDAAIVALGKLGGPACAEHLLTALDFPEPELRQDALLAIGLAGDHHTATQPLVRVLESYRDANGKHVDAPDAPFAALGLALLERPDETVPILFEAYPDALLGSGDPELAPSIATALGLLGTEETGRQLGRPLSTGGARLAQVHVCHALGRIGGNQAREKLLRTLSGHDSAIRAAAILALSAWSDKAIVDALKGKEGLKTDSLMSRLYSLWSFARIAPRLPGREPLRKYIRHHLIQCAENPTRHYYMAMHAAVALAATGDTSANNALLEHLSEGEKHSVEVLSASALALGFTGDRRAVQMLEGLARRKSQDQDLRGYALFALALMRNTESLPLIRELLAERRQRHQVMRSGCWALALMGDHSDLPLLLKFLEVEGSDPGFHSARGAAAIAIGLIGDESAVAPLVKLAKEAKSATTVAFAIAALGWLVDKDPVPQIPLLFSNFHYRAGGPVFRAVMSTL